MCCAHPLPCRLIEQNVIKYFYSCCSQTQVRYDSTARHKPGCNACVPPRPPEQVRDKAVSVYAMESMAYLTVGILDSQDSPNAALEAACVKVGDGDGCCFVVARSQIDRYVVY